ncbi:hypothetical protein [Paraburkholderia bannensis]|uniref:hypothetical protein n=1 Tax=Paraburkholderia bannensis TaxID=765414 RepID=UPI002ABDE196|nr:hypothetical protein [Paraburkholderia bannensis]
MGTKIHEKSQLFSWLFSFLSFRLIPTREWLRAHRNRVEVRTEVDSPMARQKHTLLCRAFVFCLRNEAFSLTLRGARTQIFRDVKIF